MAIAASIASGAAPGDVICLSGPLGAGKTAFAQGFALGLGVEDYVNSPTFTIMQIYGGGRLPLYHFDLYRLTSELDEDSLEDIGFFEYLDKGGVCLIEWAEYARDFIEAGAIWVDIKVNNTGREIIVQGGRQ